MEAPIHPQPDPSAAVAPSPQPSVADILTGLHNSVPHKFLYDDWRREEKDLRLRMHRKEQNRSSAESEIYQLLGIFCVFQGVFFGALAQTNIFHCEDWLSPFVMSLIVFVATLLAVEQKIWAFAEIETELTHARQEAQALYESMTTLVDEGSDYDLNRLNYEPRVVIPVEDDDSNFVSKLLFQWILTRGFGVRGLVIVISTIILVSCQKILCRACKCQS